jgi:hypothetical protein
LRGRGAHCENQGNSGVQNPLVIDLLPLVYCHVVKEADASLSPKGKACQQSAFNGFP